MKVRYFPVHLEIETTNACNLHCIMCPRRKMTRPVQDMEWSIFRKIINEARGKTKSCYLHMIGEPLMNILLPYMINQASFAGIKTSISTNCMLLDDSWIARLLINRLDELVLAIDGVDEATYNKYRVGGDFQRVKHNIDRCIEARRSLSTSRTELVVQFIVMKENEAQIEAVKKEYEEKLDGIGRVLIKEYSRFAGFVDDLSPNGIKPRRTWCSKLRTHMAIQSDGDVVICCRDFDKFTVIGNVKDHSLHDLWHSDKYNVYREEFDKRCWTNPLCKDC